MEVSRGGDARGYEMGKSREMAVRFAEAIGNDEYQNVEDEVEALPAGEFSDAVYELLTAYEVGGWEDAYDRLMAAADRAGAKDGSPKGRLVP